jgi:pimeloyl-ACP methyl ester carboxylesterase
MGGHIAFAMLRLAPERVAKLALLDTSARPDTAEQSVQREKLIVLADSGKLNDVVEILAPRFLHRSRQNDEALKRTMQKMAADIGPKAFVRQQRAIMSRVDSRPFLAAIHCPTLVLVGDGDELTPPELSKEICTGIPSARLTVVPDCGHLSTLEKPDAVNAALAEWLST